MLCCLVCPRSARQWTADNEQRAYVGKARREHDAGAEAARDEQQAGVPPPAEQRQRHADRRRRQDGKQPGDAQLLALRAVAAGTPAAALLQRIEG